mmetsp:Transcript_121429/g.303025  ORF Transcript_121429/g.303025 Transcript_121429/m.303025 type:complete len:461 (-) Transcript_121429:79-1461(-)
MVGRDSQTSSFKTDPASSEGGQSWRLSNVSMAARRTSRVRYSATVVERALALAPQRTRNFGQVSMATTRQCGERVLRSPFFECLTMAVILASAVEVGLMTQRMAEEGVLDEDLWRYRAADLSFCVYFSAELLLRLFVYRGRFLQMWGWGWNLFDAMLVLSQVVEELMLASAGGSGGLGLAAGLGSLSPTYLVRGARLLRAARVIRVLHIVRFTEELRVLVGCIANSMKAFFWSMILLFLLIYVASLLLTQVVLVHRLENPSEIEASHELARWYGTVPGAVFSLFQGLTGGQDWGALVAPLIRHISPAWGVLFCMYVAFGLFAMMNVVTATFVEGVIQRAAQVKEIQKMRDATRLFKSLDLDQSGCITLDEIANHLGSPEVEAFFQSIDVDVREACCLFELMDVEGTGAIGFEEFLSGCIRLQGPAKAWDLVMAMQEIRAAFAELNKSAMALGKCTSEDSC